MPPCFGGRIGLKPARSVASSSDIGPARPAIGERCGAFGSFGTRSIVSPPTWKKRRIAVRAGGTAKAAPIATTSAASASTSTRRRAKKRSRGAASPRRARTAGTRSGSGGKASSRPTSRRSRSSSGIRLPQPVEGARRPRLDRPAPDAEHLGRLVLGQLEEVAAGDHESLRLGQRVDGRDERLALLAYEECRLGGGGRLPRGALRSRPQGEGVAARARTAAVASLVRDDLQ